MKQIAAILFFVTSAMAADFHLTVAGLGGEPDYDTRFNMLAAESKKLMGGDVLSGPSATKAGIQKALAGYAAQAKPEDTLVLLLIGHGNLDGSVFKFNVPGPDVTVDELRAWLDRIQGKQLVVLSTSCSGAVLEPLKHENRVVITATRTGTEKNAVVFARYWVEALRDAGADADKNETVTALEAFNYAKQKTAGFYETQKRLATEHSVLDDNSLAARLAVVRFGAAQKAMNDPQKKLMLARKEELESAIDKLKFEKAAMPIAEYKSKLSALLMELARIQEDIEK
ncbi:C13 family peptidase [uncultured Paludibaculum sp.]|uniref:C13 family peptidase n=1 Tax=uncultured Paludibaculum sp. TaxID=1765020 RepID=UPI002AABC471|nr:C13 family peptidase [uncultured Paludibaculum sp.]